jgi:hypothetical protein
MLIELTGHDDPAFIEHTHVIFTSLEAAEWEVFGRRWRRHTGEDLMID